MINFRFHRGSLSESLKTAIKFSSLRELLIYIQNFYLEELLIDLNSIDFNIKYYGYDQRVKQQLNVIGFIFEEEK